MRRGTCIDCTDDLPSRKTTKLSCGHRMCNSCLRSSFQRSVKNPQHMPPRCCNDRIPLEHVEHLFDQKFISTWNRKFHEYSKGKRLYCPSKRCRDLIQPENIYEDRGRKCGQCSRCGTKVCGDCNRKWHSSRECIVDDPANHLFDQGRDQGLRRCHRCRSIVELTEGSSPMTW